jgi:hypothetical protein
MSTGLPLENPGDQEKFLQVVSARPNHTPPAGAEPGRRLSYRAAASRHRRQALASGGSSGYAPTALKWTPKTGPLGMLN